MWLLPDISACARGGTANFELCLAKNTEEGAMQNVVNKVKSAALGVADSLTPVLKVSVHCSRW